MLFDQIFAIMAVTAAPATGNVESSTYIGVLAVAGVLIVAAVLAGILGKKKK